VPSRTELDSAEAAFKRAQAQEASGRADIAKAEAVLKANRSDLAKATITSPINGVVLERKVEPGQTVAASLQTPLLFKLAEDLRQMELRIFVDEADVGQVKEGQTAVFTVDAFPDRKFPARVKQARFAPRTENNVVTYETILEVDNTDMLLRPGMTATAFITVNSVANAVLIPNAALRFSPPQDKSQKQDSGGNTLLASLLNRRPPGNNMRQKQQKQDEMPTIWKVDGESLACVPVKLGVTDGMMTQIVEGDVEPGAVIATDTVKAKQ
jgi:HlyD family secretion protein